MSEKHWSERLGRFVEEGEEEQAAKIEKDQSATKESVSIKVRRLKATGYTDEEIASVLNIKPDEVSTYLSKIYGETGSVKRSVQETMDGYNEILKDLTQLIVDERKKHNKDARVMLDAIRLKIEIQDKKKTLLVANNPSSTADSDTNNKHRSLTSFGQK